MDRALDLFLLLKDAPLRVLHQLAFAAAVGLVIYGHVLLRDPGKAIEEDQARRMRWVSTATAWALGVLVLTGFWRAIIGSMGDPFYWENEKLVAKVGIVTLACINGAWMHLRVFPRMVAGAVPAEWALGFQVKAALAAAVSIAAWSWASLLGVARDWNYEATYAELFVGFTATVALVYVVALREVARSIVMRRQFFFTLGDRVGSIHVRLPHKAATQIRTPRRQDRLEGRTQEPLSMDSQKETVPVERGKA